MRQLRHREQRNKIHLPARPIPIRPEKPILFVPHAAIPKKLLDIGQRPKRREKDDPILGKRYDKPARSIRVAPSHKTRSTQNTERRG